MIWRNGPRLTRFINSPGEMTFLEPVASPRYTIAVAAVCRYSLSIYPHVYLDSLEPELNHYLVIATDLMKREKIKPSWRFNNLKILLPWVNIWTPWILPILFKDLQICVINNWTTVKFYDRTFRLWSISRVNRLSSVLFDMYVLLLYNVHAISVTADTRI